MMSRQIQAALPTWTGSDTDLAAKLGTTHSRIAGERYRMNRGPVEERRTWADRVVSAPHLAAQPATRERAAAKARKPAPDIPSDIAAMRAQARMVPCPTCDVQAGECLDVPGARWDLGVHEARLTAAGLPPTPSVADLNAGLRPICTAGIWTWAAKRPRIAKGTGR